MDVAKLATPRNLIIGGVAIVGGLLIAKFAFKPRSEAAPGPPISQTIVRDPANDQGELDRNRPPSAAPTPAPVTPPLGLVPFPKQTPITPLPTPGQAPRLIPAPAPPIPHPAPPRIIPTPAPRPISYPGNVILNCNSTSKALLGDWNNVLRTQQSKGPHLGAGAFLARNMYAIAAYGIPSPWLNRGDWSDPAAINRRRTMNGLFPLTQNEVIALLDDIHNHGQYGLEDLSGAEQLFNRWNRPYQCGVHH